MAVPSTLTPTLDDIRLDQRRRWQAGDRVHLETYLERHPALGANSLGLLQLVYYEVLIREEMGDRPRSEEYLSRFPHLARHLHDLFDVHHALDACAPADGDQAGGDAAVAHATRTEAGEEWPRVTDCEILGVLGRGGMGVVYKARQVRLDRVVALKMILAGPHAERAHVQRFYQEGQAVARLQHPNIVQIHEVGEADNRPYFALEFVDGGSLVQKLAGTPQPPAEAAKLVETLSRTMHYAHQQRIVHRDLKPANVLFTSDGVPKITDFGLAKRLDAQGDQSLSGTIVGTPSYMAPEQAAGQCRLIGPAADVYSLGAILYELLTGRPPFKGTTMLDTLDQVRTQDPVPPCSLQPKVPRDLETICLKCLQKEEHARYESAEALAQDLCRFLAGEPIDARPVTPIEALWRWCRRKRTVAGLAAALILVVVGALVGLTALWLAAREQSAAAKRERDTAQQAEQRAATNLQLALDALFFIDGRVADAGLTNVPQMEVMRREVLEYTLQAYQKLFENDETDPELRLATAKGHVRVAEIRQLLGQAALAETALRQGIALVDRLAGDYPDEPIYRTHWADARLRLGSLVAAGGRTLEAETLFEQVQAFLDRAPESYRNGINYRLIQATVYSKQAVLLFDGKRLEEAKQKRLLSLALNGQLAREFPNDRAYLQNLADDYNSLGVIQRWTGHLPEALAAYEQAVKLQEELLGRHPADARLRDRLGTSYRNLGFLLRTANRYPEARKAYRRAIELHERLVNDFPSVPAYHSELGQALQGAALVDGGQPGEEKWRQLEQAVAQQERALQLDPQSPRYRQSLRNATADLGMFLAHSGQLARSSRAAHRLVELALEPFDYLHAARTLAYCTTYAERATHYPPEKRKEMALAFATEAVAILRLAVRKKEIIMADLQKVQELEWLGSYAPYKEFISSSEK